MAKNGRKQLLDIANIAKLLSHDVEVMADAGNEMSFNAARTRVYEKLQGISTLLRLSECNYNNVKTHQPKP